MAEEMRLDRFLWFTRIAKKRDWAQALATSGHLRIDGRAVAKASVSVRVGQVLTFAARTGEVRAIRVAALPARRGPPAEARACYEEMLATPAAKNVSQEEPDD